jgi:4-amino-4-deoxy-L-arabinose transferase-like glycosyltransferase
MNRKSPEATRIVWIVAAFVAGLLGYWFLFFTAVPPRLECFRYLLLPEEIVMSWVAGDTGLFGVSDRPLVLLAAGMILAVAFVFGRLSLAVGQADGNLSRTEILLFSLGVGLNELSLMTLAIGLAGGLRNVWAFAVSFSLVVGLGCWAWKRGLFRREAVADTTGADARAGGSGWLERWGLWLATPFVLLILFGGMLPPWDFDVREYHLQVPKEWYQNGRIDFLPHNVYGNMPLGAEMHALLAMVFMPGQRPWWWGALVGKTVIAALAPLTALALFAAGRRFASASAGAVAALVFVSLPWIVHVSVNGLVEGAVGFYTFLALYAMLLCRTDPASEDNTQSSRGHRGRWMLAGFLAGSAAACKYPALLFVVAPVAVWCVLVPSRDRWRAVLTVSLAAMCGCGLWLGKNWVLADNPVYPLVFGGQTRTAERMDQWNRAHRVPPDENGRRYSIRQVAEAAARVASRSPWQSPLLLPFVALALALAATPSGGGRWARGSGQTVHNLRKRLIWTLAGYAALFFAVWWLMTHRIDRFWVPLLPVLAMLAGLGATWTASRLWHRVLVATLIAGMAANLLYVITTNRHDHRYLVALDLLRVDEPDQPHGPSRVHPAHQYLNSAVPPEQCVLLVGDAQPFDLEVPTLYNTCFDESIFERLLKGRAREQRLAALREHRISHVLVDWSEIDRYRSPGNYGFTDYVSRTLVRDELAREQQLLRRVELGADPEWWEVFEVVP